MAKQRPDNSSSEGAAPARQPAQPRKAPRAATGLPWHAAWRILVSLLVVLHLLAVFVAPWDLATFAALPPGYQGATDSLGRPLPPGRDVLQEPIVTRFLRGTFFRNYLNLLYLNHGYEFFAPDPAGSFVIDYRVTKTDGTLVEGRFPDLSAQWPRLLYHRHMMLAAQLEMINNQLVQMGKRLPFTGQVLAEHLATLHGGQATLDLKNHLLLSPERVLAGRPLDEPSTYRLLGTITGNPRPERRSHSANGSQSEAPIAIPGAGR